MAISGRPFFSIITATFHASALFQRTAASLAKQTDQDFEWIVVDGGSSDNTVNEIKKCEHLLKYWISEPDRGISDAWNKGIMRAEGAYVLILNAGDEYDPDFLFQVRKAADGNKIVVSAARLYLESGQCIGIFHATPGKLSRGMHLPHNWCAVPLALYKRFGSYTEIPFSMDFEWFHRYYVKFGRGGFIVIQRAMGNYYLGGKSDKFYGKGFIMNEKIIVENGGNKFIAKLWRIIYIAKHWLRNININ